MSEKKLDTTAIGIKAFNIAYDILLDAGHLIQKVDGDADIGIDGYIRIRKRVSIKKISKGKEIKEFKWVDTGDLIGVQVKGVTKIPASGAHSYYVNIKDKTKFGVNLKTGLSLSKRKAVWQSFIGPMIMIFVEVRTRKAWWTDLNNSSSYSNDYDYMVIMDKKQTLDATSFKQIKKLGKEAFAKKQLLELNTGNYSFPEISLTNFKESAKSVYENLGVNGLYYPIVNPKLGNVTYSRSGWKHITRLNRRKMRIFNSLLLLTVSKMICEHVSSFSRVKRGEVRETKRYIKKVDFLTLRAHVNFNFRESAVVQVVLRRVKTFDKINALTQVPDAVFFHSVYEPFRKE